MPSAARCASFLGDVPSELLVGFQSCACGTRTPLASSTERRRIRGECGAAGGTVLRTEKGGPGNAAYHAHVRKTGGTEVVVLVDASFEATSVEEHPERP